MNDDCVLIIVAKYKFFKSFFTALKHLKSHLEDDNYLGILIMKISDCSSVIVHQFIFGQPLLPSKN